MVSVPEAASTTFKCRHPSNPLHNKTNTKTKKNSYKCIYSLQGLGISSNLMDHYGMYFPWEMRESANVHYLVFTKPGGVLRGGGTDLPFDMQNCCGPGPKTFRGTRAWGGVCKRLALYGVGPRTLPSVHLAIAK